MFGNLVGVASILLILIGTENERPMTGDYASPLTYQVDKRGDISAVGAFTTHTSERPHN